jgi:DNA-binding NarL/FixJ family response regulator
MPRPVNALIVDDEAHVRVLIRMLLKQLGIITIWDAPDGATALEMAAAHKPDVILLDINLPQVGGLEVLAKLKVSHPTIPVIIVSSQSTMKTVSQTRELGAAAYVLKHAPKTEVLQMLSDAFDEIAAGSGEEPAADGGEKPQAPA